MKSTSGLSIWPRNCLAYADSDSTYRRWPSAKIVSNARLDLPEPDSPVNTIMASLGRSSETSLRLCSRAPRTTSRSATVRSVSPGLGGEIDGENGACKARAQWYPGPLTFSGPRSAVSPQDAATGRPSAPPSKAAPGDQYSRRAARKVDIVPVVRPALVGKDGLREPAASAPLGRPDHQPDRRGRRPPHRISVSTDRRAAQGALAVARLESWPRAHAHRPQRRRAGELADLGPNGGRDATVRELRGAERPDRGWLGQAGQRDHPRPVPFVGKLHRPG